MPSIFARSVAFMSLALACACASESEGPPAALSTATLGEDDPVAETGERPVRDADPAATGDAHVEAPSPSETGSPSTGPSPSGDVARLAAGNRAFAFELFRTVAAQRAGENVVLSPYGVSSALAMVFAGARRLTVAELGASLHFEVPPPALHAAFAEVSRQLATRGPSLALGSQVWVQDGLPIAPAFEEVLRTRYGGAPALVDFAGDPAGARAAINARVAERTGTQIAELLQPSDVSSATELVLTSAASLSARWQVPFEAAAPATFAGVAEVPTIVARGTFARARGDGYQAVAIPYEGDALRLIAVLPDAGSYQAIEGALDAAWFDALRASLKDEALTVALPRFAARARTPLREALSELDVRSLFRGGDLTGISDDGVRLENVIHAATIEVTEQGAQAAATSGVGTSASGAEAETVRFDRPFLYAVVDEPTGQILFLGRVLSP